MIIENPSNIKIFFHGFQVIVHQVGEMSIWSLLVDSVLVIMLRVSEDKRRWCVLLVQAFMQYLLNTYYVPSVLYLVLGMWSWTRHRWCPHGICRERRGTHQGVKDKIIIRALTEICPGWCLNAEEILDHIVQWPHEAPAKSWPILRHAEERRTKREREKAGMQRARGWNQHEADEPHSSSSQHS